MRLLKNLVYTVGELATLGRGLASTVGGERVRFPVAWSRYYEADYEPETFEFLRAHLRPGSVFLDIGAHIGLFSVLGSRLVSPDGRVFSFEPTPFTRQVLKKVVELNGVGNIAEVRGEAVSAKKGQMQFFDTGDVISNANSLVATERAKSSVMVDVVSVDEFVRERALKPDCLKIDVEGAELDLLRGARETFTTHRPVARLGLHPPQVAANGHSLEEIWDLLAEYGMTVVYEGSKVEKNWFCEQGNLFDVNLLPR